MENKPTMVTLLSVPKLFVDETCRPGELTHLFACRRHRPAGQATCRGEQTMVHHEGRIDSPPPSQLYDCGDDAIGRDDDVWNVSGNDAQPHLCLLYTSPSPRD